MAIRETLPPPPQRPPPEAAPRGRSRRPAPQPVGSSRRPRWGIVAGWPRPRTATAARAASAARARRGIARARSATRIVAFWRKAYEDNVTGLSGMVAYSLLLSIFPFALVALFIGGRLLRSEDPAGLPCSTTSSGSSRPLRSRRCSEARAAAARDRRPTAGIAAIAAAVWFGASFWGALDTAFCRIYHCPVPAVGAAEAVRARDARHRAGVRRHDGGACRRSRRCWSRAPRTCRSGCPTSAGSST